MKNREVIEKILAYHPALENYAGCDDYKYGDPEAECRGVAVALVPTVDVIRRAAELGCNLLVTHEPIFYQTPDFAEWKGSFPNEIYEEKCRLLDRCGMTVWRDHDHMHAHKPDSIFSGVIRALGWEDYYRPGKNGADMCYRFELPATTVRELGAFLMKKLRLNGLRYMGKPDDVITKAALVGHFCPDCFYKEGIGEDGFYHAYAMDVIQMMEQEGIEVIIPGEIIEWTALAYIRDAVALGRTKACLNIGHFNLEELGMADFAERIKELTQGALPVHYVPTRDGFSYL